MLRKTLVGLIVALTSCVWASSVEAADAPPPRHIAVVTWGSAGPGSDAFWLAEGVTETLTAQFNEIPGLVAIRRIEVRRVEAKPGLSDLDLTDPQSAAQVGKFLGIERVVIGTCSLNGPSVRFTIRVVASRGGVVLGQADVSGSVDEIFVHIGDLAEAAVGAYDRIAVPEGEGIAVADAPVRSRIILTDEQKQQLRNVGTDSLFAWKAFAAGCAAAEAQQAIDWFTRAMGFDAAHAQAFNARGVVDGGGGLPDEAIADFEKAIELKPGYAEAWRNLGWVLEKNGDIAGAVAKYTRAIELKPESAEYHNLRGGSYYAQGECERAGADFKRALLLKPNDGNAYYTGGEGPGPSLGAKRAAITVLTEGNAVEDMNQKIELYSEAIELDPTFAAAWANRGDAYGNLGRWTEAIADFTKAIELNPNYASAWKHRGSCYKANRRYREAVRDFTRAIELVPGSAACYISRADCYYYGLFSVELALKDYNKAIELTGGTTELHRKRGNVQMNRGRWHEALADLETSLELDPQNIKTHLALTAVHGQLDDDEAVLRDYENVLEFAPNDTLVLGLRALFYEHLEQYELALKDRIRLVELFPDDPVAFIYRGNAHEQLTNYDRAIEDYDRAVELDPDNFLAYNCRGWLYYKKKDYDQAVADISRYIETGPTNRAGHGYLGLYRYKMGKPDPVTGDADEPVWPEPDYVFAFYNRALLHGELEKHDLAIADYSRYIAMKPDDPDGYNGRGWQYCQKGDYDAAWADVEKCRELDGELDEEFLTKLKADSGREQ